MKKILLLLCICFYEMGYSQGVQQIFLPLTQNVSYNSTTFDQTLKQILTIDSQTSFNIYEETTDSENFTCLKINQYYGDYRLLESELMVYVYENNIGLINGTYYSLIEPAEKTSSLTESEILQIATNAVAFGEDDDIQYETEKVLAHNFFEPNDKTLYYAYRITITNSTSKPVEVVIDECTGKILDKPESLQWTTAPLFNDKEQIWKEVESYYDVFFNESYCVCDCTTTKGEPFEKDGITYFPIYRKIWSDKGPEFQGVFRQDGEKYYYTPNDDEQGQEYLLYDFGLQKGDEFFSSYHYYNRDIDDFMHFKVIDVKIMTDDKGIQRKQIILNNDVWIEGIGSVYGLLNSLCCYRGVRMADIGSIQLVDYSENGESFLKYQPACSYDIPYAITSVNQTISISPNPVKDKLTVTLPKTSNEIQIFDMQGKLWLQQNVGQTAEIQVSMLPAGTYVLVANGESYKFVKE